MAKEPLGAFENKDRLLSDDEKELIGVLTRFYEHIEDLRARVKALEDLVETLYSLTGPTLVKQKVDDA